VFGSAWTLAVLQYRSTKQSFFNDWSFVVGLIVLGMATMTVRPRHILSLSRFLTRRVSPGCGRRRAPSFSTAHCFASVAVRHTHAGRRVASDPVVDVVRATPACWRGSVRCLAAPAIFSREVSGDRGSSRSFVQFVEEHALGLRVADKPDSHSMSRSHGSQFRSHRYPPGVTQALDVLAIDRLDQINTPWKVPVQRPDTHPRVLDDLFHRSFAAARSEAPHARSDQPVVVRGRQPAWPPELPSLVRPA